MKDFSYSERYKAIIAELVGTFFLALAALLSGSPFAVGLTLAAFVYAIGDISGCHINPAVTVGLLARRKLPILWGLPYILAQLIGALLARQVAVLINPLPVSYTSGNMFAEFFGVAFLILTVMAVSDGYVPKPASGLAIGAALAAGLVTSKGILNPAIAVAMGLPMSPGTWAAFLGGLVFALISLLYTTRKISYQ
ncbi:MAG: aquaporin [Ktedonobacteraceae bacterium]|nr:aquaporin [Ktedonobacteraceae bacterium]